MGIIGFSSTLSRMANGGAVEGEMCSRMRKEKCGLGGSPQYIGAKYQTYTVASGPIYMFRAPRI